MSHVSLFTGSHPAHHRVYAGAKAWQEETFVRRLAAEGSLAAANTEGGKAGGWLGFARGFDRYEDGRRDRTGDAAHTFAEAAVWLVPLGFRWPGRIERGASEMPVELVDVMPTLLDLTGILQPASLAGRSLAPLLTGRRPTLATRPVFAELRSAPGQCARKSRDIRKS